MTGGEWQMLLSGITFGMSLGYLICWANERWHKRKADEAKAARAAEMAVLMQRYREGQERMTKMFLGVPHD